MIIPRLKLHVSVSMGLGSFFVIMSKVVRPCSRFTLSNIANNLSQNVVSKLSLFKSFNIKITDWVDRFFLYFSASTVSPVIFNTQSMPLINYGHNFFAWQIPIYLIEKVTILFVDENFFLQRSHFLEEFNKPTNFIAI